MIEMKDGINLGYSIIICTAYEAVQGYLKTHLDSLKMYIGNSRATT